MNITFSILHSLSDRQGDSKKRTRDKDFMLGLFQMILKKGKSPFRSMFVHNPKLSMFRTCLLDIPIFKRDCEHASISDVFF